MVLMLVIPVIISTITVHPGLKIALISTAVKRKPTNVAAKMVIKLSIIKNIHRLGQLL